MIIPIILGVVFVIFLLLYAIPSGGLNMFPSAGKGDALDALFKLLHAGNNFFTKYLRYCYNVFILHDFGRASGNSLKIIGELVMRTKLTLLLTGLGLAATLIIGVPIGIFSAVHQNKWQDNVIMFLVTLFSSIPNYCLAIILCIVFVLKLRVLPLIGFAGPIYFVLPTMTLSAGGIASVTKMTRASMLEVLDQQYVTALRSKGLKERAVVYFHALKNALVPIVSVLGTLTTQMLCGAVVVEHFFSIPGLGSYLLRSVNSRDVTSLLGCSVIIAFMLAALSVITDILYVFVDPQIKQQYTKGKTSALRRKEARQ
ncbi:MAG: ABC transporter permease [Oscillospiraceae bacterium]|jgi:ABC-type dipeptide/oligopeptide/nickel transport system permease component|nr:ABC transporter permease [Oscillospiraceae bacterium]